ncbi:protein kinase-like (pk-like) [Lasallia pustulata]|uniref:non-specific serine/threonine protein kinase n=1 Tax=Lasallia pustulata TaxID=136370 RepID=A0A1W5CXG9_9LECA|nr:protein kinase-like (pk-like) [Lasallia pustulata]
MPMSEIRDNCNAGHSRSVSGRRVSPMPGNAVSLPKNRSTGNLLSDAARALSDNRKIRFSFDAGSGTENGATVRPPILPEHEHGLGVSGLRRIRQQPPYRNATQPSSPELSFSSPSKSPPMIIAMPFARTNTPMGPLSPTLNYTEDLSRFPSESLHSFSFAHQSEDVLHSRQNILRKSIDFMRDRLGWPANHPGLMQAQAKVSGDAELQSMMDLLARANVLGDDPDNAPHSGYFNGALTGPADIDGGNVFEKSFLSRSESPEMLDENMARKEVEQRATSESQTITEPSEQMSSLDTIVSPKSNVKYRSPRNEMPDLQPSNPLAERTTLKRTYTDTAPLSLQTKLMETLARPFQIGQEASNDKLFSQSSAFGKPLNVATRAQSVVHTHGHAYRWAPAAQAIFTTETRAPWTILAANDLACLVFGVTKAEVRKLGILEVVREDRRAWLEEKLRSPGSEAAAKARSPYSKTRRTSSTHTTSFTGGGVTAQLLSKPPSRYSAAFRRAQTDDGSGSSFAEKKTARSGLHHTAQKSRGVLLCGDVVPIQKRNGATGSASLWVKEKRGGLIWVLEEIVEDVSHLSLDEEGHIISIDGASESIWGTSRIEIGTEVRQLVPQLPVSAKGGVDFEQTRELQHFTARNIDSVNVPISITVKADLGDMRVSSFPHIAGIMVLSASTLKINSFNSVFSAALFGQRDPDGLSITDLIPGFEKILDLLTEEDNINLVDGIVIPEHSFRRARAILALREGKADAAAIFLHAPGLVAKHRDGTEMNVDVQMRVVKSESFISPEAVIEEKSEDGEDDEELSMQGGLAASEVVYALWITYSRHLHSAMHSRSPIASVISRQPSPPRQPSPGQADLNIAPQAIDTEDIKPQLSPTSLLTLQIQEAASQPISTGNVKESAKANVPVAKPTEVPKKRMISDFVIIEEMGQGAYGQVKLARYKKNSAKKVVLKYVTKRRILVDTWTRDRKLGTVPLEIHVLDYLRRDGLKHPNIVEMTDFFEDDMNYYIEMVPHGLPGMDLFDYIEMRSTMEEAECRNIFRQVVAALHHLHTKALVVHRDIKDENIVLDGDNKVKLIDFGSAAYIKNGPFDVFVGTIDYAAPEVLQGKSYRGKEQDVWALGILLYTLVYKENPFYSIDEIMDHELRIPWIMSESSIDLIKAMLDRDVDRRLTITQVVEHPWCLAEGGA